MVRWLETIHSNSQNTTQLKFKFLAINAYHRFRKYQKQQIRYQITQEAIKQDKDLLKRTARGKCEFFYRFSSHKVLPLANVLPVS